MSSRSFAFGLFIISIFVILQRQKANHEVTIHSPAQPVKISTNSSSLPYYHTGSIRQAKLPKISILQLFTRKKIDNFVFNHYNHYKLELTFVDLGYSSNFMFSFSAEEYPYFKITQKIGFDITEDMLTGSLNLDINKRNFNLTVRQYTDSQQTITTFNLSFIRKQSNVNANLTHVIRNNQCFTAVRKNNIVSHKCFGGIGEGKVKIDHIVRTQQHPKRLSNMLNPTFNLTRTVYDGLRGSGMHWRWVWGILSGFSKIQFYALNHTIPKQHWLGLNFGHIHNQGQDFAFINGNIIPIEGLSYTFDQNLAVGANISVTATRPQLNANFTVHKKHHELEDLGIIKLDMVKFEGNWAGNVKDEKTGRIFQFYEIAGHIQSCDSLF